jgi:hypothetical protein
MMGFLNCPVGDLDVLELRFEKAAMSKCRAWMTPRSSLMNILFLYSSYREVFETFRETNFAESKLSPSV